jgi:hypothetical protein
MCLGSTQSYPDIGPRDTSEEVIKSKYELSAENKAANVQRIAKAKSLVTFDNDGGSDTDGSDTDGGGSSNGYGGGRGTGNDAYGGGAMV